MAGHVLLEPRLGGGGAAEDLAARPQALVAEVLLLRGVLTSGVGVLQLTLFNYSFSNHYYFLLNSLMSTLGFSWSLTH